MQTKQLFRIEFYEELNFGTKMAEFILADRASDAISMMSLNKKGFILIGIAPVEICDEYVHVMFDDSSILPPPESVTEREDDSEDSPIFETDEKDEPANSEDEFMEDGPSQVRDKAGASMVPPTPVNPSYKNGPPKNAYYDKAQFDAAGLPYPTLDGKTINPDGTLMEKE